MPPSYRGPRHRIAWDGISFEVPDTWNLAEYAFKKRLTRIELEDDYEPRMFAEWTISPVPITPDSVDKRYKKQSRKLVEKSKEERIYEDMPPGWHARLYRQNDGARIVVAYYLRDSRKFFALLQLYFSKDSREDPRLVLNLIAETFQRHHNPVPWAVYDISYEMPGNLRLLSTELAAGRKLMVFHRGMRKFHVWHFSVADVVTEEYDTPAKFAASFLNFQPHFRALDIDADGEDRLICKRRRWRYPLGHFDEIGRMCFKYRAGLRLLPDRNMLRIWIYNYRRDRDITDIPADWLPHDTHSEYGAKPRFKSEHRP